MWHGIETEEGSGKAPLLAGTLGSLECRLVAEHAVGDHTLFVGEVESVRLGGSAPPLVYYDGTYRAL
jgi:flavin reductase (DIM6/NTAB) family NADH-FMN oxidoreductase RutF